MLSKNHQYSTFHFTVPTVDDSEISFYLPERLPVQLAWTATLETMAIGAENNHIRKSMLFDSGPVLYVFNR